MAKERELTVSQQQLEEFINDHEQLGEMLVSMGLISKKEFKEATDADEEFRLKIEANPALAEAANEAVAKGASLQQVEQETQEG